MLQSAPLFGMIFSTLRLQLSRNDFTRALHPCTRMSCFLHSSSDLRAQQSSSEQGAPGKQETPSSATLDGELQIETVAAPPPRPQVQPLLYSQTKAAQWSASQTFRRAPKPDRPWYQGYVISFSYASILILVARPNVLYCGAASWCNWCIHL